jgi:hypothetical protein
LATFELTGFGELVEKLWNGGDLVGFLGNAKLRISSSRF